MKELSDDKLYVSYWNKYKLPFDPDAIRIVLGDPLFSVNKPQEAFWGSPVNSRFGWKEWCEAEEIFVEDFDWDNPILFKLKPNSTILRIDVQDLKDEILGKYVTKNEKILEELRLRFNEEELSSFSRFVNYLDFNKIVADGIDAVQLMNGTIGHYFWDNDYEGMFNSWDCESIVVLNKDVIEFIERGKIMKKYDIYEEGFRTNGEHALARFIGIGYGNNFLEACKEYHERTGRGELKKCLDGSYCYADWGCRWFPTLEEAQELCG